MSHQYGNKSKSQLTSPTPAQLPAVAVSTGHIVYMYMGPTIVFFFSPHILAVSELINQSLPWNYDFKFVVEEISNVNDKSQVSPTL
jgi:hypothetical protein